MKHRKRAIAAVTACMLAVTSVPAFAYSPTGPGASPEAGRYSEEELARLQDNILEYSEIQNRVREYNPTISQAWKTYEDTRQDYANMVTELESQYQVVKDLADTYTSAGEMTGNPVLIATAKQLKKGYQSTVESMEDTVSQWNDNKSTGSIRSYERQMTAGAQQAMIGYDTIRQNMATLETMVQLYDRQYQMYTRQKELGLATDKDVLSSYTSLLSAQSQLASLSNQADGVRRSLCQLLGYDPDTNPEIRSLPAFDMTRLEGMNLEEDTKKAIGNNYTLISQRTSAAGKTNAKRENRNKILDEGDQKLTIEMQRLYQDVMDKKAAYDAAATGYQAAEASWGAAQRQYQNGLISEIQYIGLQLAYYQKKAALESANLSLWQAMENLAMIPFVRIWQLWRLWCSFMTDSIRCTPVRKNWDWQRIRMFFLPIPVCCLPSLSWHLSVIRQTV